jgi:hypothetical protein
MYQMMSASGAAVVGVAGEIAVNAGAPERGRPRESLLLAQSRTMR